MCIDERHGHFDCSTFDAGRVGRTCRTTRSLRSEPDLRQLDIVRLSEAFHIELNGLKTFWRLAGFY